MAMHRIFVYGTLKDEDKLKDQWDVNVLDSRDATVKGRIYRVKGRFLFPVLVEGGDKSVHGKLFTIDKNPKAFDEYEGATGKRPLNHRKRITVETSEAKVEAWCYIGNPDHALIKAQCVGENLIASGRWES
tara:strand:- start:58 stop:450 length:393 start_codon:yes stop_codon:yes gene_type:complete